MARIALAALVVAGCAALRAPWAPPALPATAERLTARTPDGWDLSLIHYGTPRPGRRPVLLLHGIATNERSLDFDEQHSLARFLAAGGLDVYAMSLRGTGLSSKPALIGGPRKYDWDFDTFAEVDLPTAVEFVRSRTGAAQIDFIGHSLGGMILYAMLALHPDAPVAAAATLGSPVGFRWGPRFTSLALDAAVAGSHLPVLALQGGSLLLLPLMSWYPTPASLIFYNPQNMDPRVWEGFTAIGVEDESPVLAAQAARWIREDRFTSRDGSVDYEERMRAIRTPVLVVAGKLDQLGFPPLVRRGYQALGSPRKTWLLVAEENSASADYGHIDLLLGERAARDVFTPVAQWLAEEAALTGKPAGTSQ
jgi:pimeloyl-ACP methyl ester carboxylesterase